MRDEFEIVGGLTSLAAWRMNACTAAAKTQAVAERWSAKVLGQSSIRLSQAMVRSSHSSTRTSVGTLAMMRFLRPVCYQDVPDALLPPALQTANRWKLMRRVEGKLEIAA